MKDENSKMGNCNKAKKKFYRTSILIYSIIFLLSFCYSLSISSSIAPVYIFDKPNLSMYAYGDLVLMILGNVSSFAILAVLFFLGYREKNDQLTLRKVLIYRMIDIFIYVLTIYISIFFAYVFTLGKNSFNLGFCDRISLQNIIPAPFAISLSFIFFCFYLVVFLFIVFVIENITKNSWVAITLSIILSFVETHVRTLFQFKNLIGVLPSDNVLVFYRNDQFFDLKRPSYLFSVIYWISLISVLYIVVYLLNKKQLAGNRK